MTHATPLNFQDLFNAMPGNFVVLHPDEPTFPILAISDDTLTILGKERDKIIGQGLFEVFPENPEAKTATGPVNVRKSLHNALKYQKVDQLPVVRYDILTPEGEFEERFWSASSKPVLDSDGLVSYLILAAQDVTQEINAEKNQRLLRKIEKTYNLFLQAPIAVCIVSGPENIIELANDEVLQYWGRTADVVGQPFFEAIPEAKEQGYPPLLDRVRKTGESFNLTEHPTPLIRNGEVEERFYTIVFQPYYENATDPAPTGVLSLAHNVTEQVLNRRKVEASEHRFRSLIEKSPVPLCLFVGPDMVVELANEAMISLWGKGPTVIGQPVWAFFSELNNQPVLQILDDVYLSGKTYEAKAAEVQLVRDGMLQSFYFDFIFKPLLDADGQVYGILNSALDVTTQVIVRQKIEESAAQLRSLANAMPHVVWISDAHGKVMYYNNRVADFAGAKLMPDGSWFWEGVLAPEDVESTRDAWLHAVANGITYEKEHRVQMKDGSTRWHLSRAFPQRDEHGTIIRWYGTATDVHEQKQSAEALKRYKFMADQAHDIFALMRQDGSFAYLNQQALQTLGYTWAESQNLKIYDIGPMVQESEFNQLFAIAQTKNIPHFKTLLRKKDGDTFPVEVNMVGLMLDRVPHLFAVSRDISESQLAERQLEMKNAELSRINNDLDNFIYTASHDLKAPISNIEGLLGLLTLEFPHNGSPSPETKHIMELMQESINRFRKTIGSLTDVVKLQQESSSDAVLVPLPEIIRETTLDLLPMMEATGAQLTVEVEECPVIRFSEKNLRSVIYNLLSNAIKYHSPDRVPQIKVSCQGQDNFHVLTISDNGLGIEADRTDELFIMFKRLHDHVEGTGIGLYMVKKIIDSAGGRIEVDSQLGQGTTFRIYFKQ